MNIATALWTSFALLAFAANSLLCRAALVHTDIDPTSFTSIRLFSGAITLAIVCVFSKKSFLAHGSIKGATALFIYAICFSFAYTNLPTGSGALLLFGSVQITMIIWGKFNNETLNTFQLIGVFIAFSGLVVLLLPGIESPPLSSAFLMISAGIAWAVYTILGKRATSPLAMTAGNFVFSIPFIALTITLFLPHVKLDFDGVIYAILSGAFASGIGYAIWYKVLPKLASNEAATLQLSVPVIATGLGWLVLGEALTIQIILASVTVLGGILMVIHTKTSKTN